MVVFADSDEDWESASSQAPTFLTRSVPGPKRGTTSKAQRFHRFWRPDKKSNSAAPEPKTLHPCFSYESSVAYPRMKEDQEEQPDRYQVLPCQKEEETPSHANDRRNTTELVMTSPSSYATRQKDQDFVDPTQIRGVVHKKKYQNLLSTKEPWKAEPVRPTPSLLATAHGPSRDLYGETLTSISTHRAPRSQENKPVQKQMGSTLSQVVANKWPKIARRDANQGLSTTDRQGLNKPTTKQVRFGKNHLIAKIHARMSDEAVETAFAPSMTSSSSALQSHYTAPGARERSESNLSPPPPDQLASENDQSPQGRARTDAKFHSEEDVSPNATLPLPTKKSFRASQDVSSPAMSDEVVEAALTLHASNFSPLRFDASEPAKYSNKNLPTILAPRTTSSSALQSHHIEPGPMECTKNNLSDQLADEFNQDPQGPARANDTVYSESKVLSISKLLGWLEVMVFGRAQVKSPVGNREAEEPERYLKPLTPKHATNEEIIAFADADAEHKAWCHAFDWSPHDRIADTVENLHTDVEELGTQFDDAFYEKPFVWKLALCDSVESDMVQIKELGLTFRPGDKSTKEAVYPIGTQTKISTSPPYLSNDNCMLHPAVSDRPRGTSHEARKLRVADRYTPRATPDAWIRAHRESMTMLDSFTVTSDATWDYSYQIGKGPSRGERK